MIIMEKFISINLWMNNMNGKCMTSDYKCYRPNGGHVKMFNIWN
jgi:hypothetical protein